MTPQVIAGIFILICFVAGLIVGFLDKSREQQIKNIKEWLKFGVVEAEKALGSGTGQLKLRLAYATAIEKFPWMKSIPFDTFSSWVDDALEWFNKQLESNKSVMTYVKEGV